MTRDDIISMAREAGFMPIILNHWPSELERFFNAAYAAGAAAEREACAMACDTEADNPSCLWEEPGCWKHAAENCAGAIRARGQQ